jgi:hypothetical protein
MIIRSYSCLNRRCQYQFDADADHPPCPRCQGLRVQWVPRPININSGRSAAIDKTARELAADFGMSDFRTPELGKSAVRRAPALESTFPKTTNMTFEPQPGWRINIPESALQGGGHAVCAPTGVTAKIRVDPNQGALKADPRVDMRSVTRIEASHRGSK